ncbi:MAG: 1,4-alpha-glucan branching enzyme GlgB [Planctomycetota bacterium]|nr:MAG: 1,4-alpha-glucan branching enzyme GlgB [Planctomycetota bacterium]
MSDPALPGELDLHLFAQGKHLRIHEWLGSHERVVDGVRGTSFAVWAPAASRVSVQGDFTGWDSAPLAMKPLGSSGVHGLFVPEVQAGALYKYAIETLDGKRLVKTDPFARSMEQYPGHAARVVAPSTHKWGDKAWLEARRERDALRSPLAIYEVHLGSWARVVEEDNRSLSYREIAPHLVEHALRLGFTHIELMPVMEHPFGGSWGYQVTGYFAPSSRWGDPDGLRFLIDACHRAGLGVILDWVPAHFPGDEHGLARFDGTALFEHEDPRRGKHPDWDTLIFNYGRHEVANFLLANALHWMRDYHADGLRVDAVASMLYLDYSRAADEWTPNAEGGRENLEAVAFLKSLSTALRDEFPGALLIAEESTTWPGVTKPVADGGLGFHFKWNLGWMHDTLDYFSQDPLHRKHHQDKLTFATTYEHSEHFLMPLSHDEVVHGKGSLFSKMAGDDWQKRANLRLLYTYQRLRPGKSLLFMGAELGGPNEWDHDHSLDWHLRDAPPAQGLAALLGALGELEQSAPFLRAADADVDGFRWIDCEDRDNSVLSFERRVGDAHVMVVFNFTPVPRASYRVGLPAKESYRVLLNSDHARFGGSGTGLEAGALCEPDSEAWHGRAQSLLLDLPPLGALVLGPNSSFSKPS